MTEAIAQLPQKTINTLEYWLSRSIKDCYGNELAHDRQDSGKVPIVVE